MPLDTRVKRFLDLLAAGHPPSMRDMSVADRRAGLVQLMALGGEPPAVDSVQARTVPGRAGPLDVRVYTPLAPRGASAGSSALLAGLVYFHGGGLVAGSLATHAGIARALAAASGCRVVAVAYGLAPEQPFPAALDDARCAALYIAAHAREFGIDAARLGVCGDSAGGTLAAALCQQLRDHAIPIALQLLICPILDHGRATASWRSFGRGYLIDEDTLDHDLAHYAPGLDIGDERISPLRAANLVGIPPTLIHTAEFDPLRDDGHRYFERLSHAGCRVSYTCHNGMIHLFYGLGSVIPYARTALERIGGEVRAILG